MSNRYQLVRLQDDEVLRGLSRLVARCNELTGDVLAHLAEVDSRMLYAEHGFSNLFSYCVEALGMSEGAAGRRCTAARLCAQFPEAFDLVARGDLHLSALCAIGGHARPENATRLFAMCSGMSRRQVDAILAAEFPKPDARESIRRLPAAATNVAEAVPQPTPLPFTQEIQPTAADRYKVQFTADAELRELIERACELCPDRARQGQLAKVVTGALELYVAQQEKRRFAVGRRPRKSASARAEQITPPGAHHRSQVELWAILYPASRVRSVS